MDDYSIFAQRRARLIKKMQAGVALVPTATERVRNRDSHYPYRFDSYFYYLSGFTEPGAALVLVAGKKPKSILFCRDKDPEREIWDGRRYGPQAARKRFRFDEGCSLNKLDEMIPQLLANQPVLYYAMGTDEAWDARMLGWLNQVRAQTRAGVTAPAQIKDVRLILDEMRLIKGAQELAVMRKAAQIATSAHSRAMRAVRPGKMEYEIEAELIHEFRRHGAQAPAYTPIVASGANACVLHYVENRATLRDGDLLLIDAGCELDGYASDITRTFPVNGKFKGPQKAVYEMVLAAQDAAIEAVKPGKSWIAPHQAALKVLAQGMIDLGLCKGSRDSVIESGDYLRFYMHRTGHWLGLDVHDAGEYKRDGKWCKLKPGMVLTVEPGCYVRPAKNVPEKFWNTGVRIEDDVLVTAKGREVLTHAAPKKVKDIEQLMRDHAA
ncbi:MAG TPA: Xaa-Pro aminopeptidase [Burkholderiales bacterium]|nr:Xaa-Pro aminopeptidase [Burkholderiales bacterium]